MASHLADNVLYGRDHTDTHASDNRWRHQESTSFAKHAAQAPREADQRHGTGDLSDFLKGSRMEPEQAGSGPKYTPIPVTGAAMQEPQYGEPVQVSGATTEVVCGPLLNYRHMENSTWSGSVLIVAKGGGLGDCWIPELQLKVAPASQTAGSIAPQLDPINGLQSANVAGSTSDPQFAQGGGNWRSTVQGTRLFSDPAHTFWRFRLQIPMQQTELRCEYSIPGLSFSSRTKADPQTFFIPAISESMRIMFHSCNGFSVGTDEEAWSGPALWNDVGRVHAKTPFHVM